MFGFVWKLLREDIERGMNEWTNKNYSNDNCSYIAPASLWILTVLRSVNLRWQSVVACRRRIYHLYLKIPRRHRFAAVPGIATVDAVVGCFAGNGTFVATFRRQHWCFRAWRHVSSVQNQKATQEQCSRVITKKKIVSIHCLGLFESYDSIKDIKRGSKSKKSQ